MASLSEQSRKLYRKLLDIGFPEQVCLLIAGELNTDFTAEKMLGYLRYNPRPSLEELGDELQAILSLRERIVQNHIRTECQKTINQVCRYGLVTEDEEGL